MRSPFITRSVLVLITMAAWPSPGGAQWLLISGDPQCTTCEADAEFGVPLTLWIHAVTGGVVTGITGAEFRIDGVPDCWDAVLIPDPSASAWIGDPFDGTGFNIVFPSCRTGYCVSLARMILIPNSVESDVTLNVRMRLPPSNANFPCPLVTLCNPPIFTAVCVSGGEFYINSDRSCEAVAGAENSSQTHQPPGRVPCSPVAVEGTSWAQIKRLYGW